MRALILSILFTAALAPLAAQAPAAGAHAATAGPFDPGRDSFKDLEAAKAEAKATGRRILMDVGGNWCPWCHLLHGFWSNNPEVKSLRDKDYVFLMVSYSKENKNAAFLGGFPKIQGYPHLFVLDADGKVVQSQNTSELEEGKGYSPAKMSAFLEKWTG